MSPEEEEDEEDGYHHREVNSWRKYFRVHSTIGLGLYSARSGKLDKCEILHVLLNLISSSTEACASVGPCS